MRRNNLSKLIFAVVVGAASLAQAQATTNGFIVHSEETAEADVTGFWPGGQSAGIESTGTFQATATLSNVVYYVVDDNWMDCGTLTSTSTSCNASTTNTPEASFTVSANVPYQLTIYDNVASQYDQVTLQGQDSGNSGDSFVIPFVISDGNTTGVQSGNDWIDDATNSNTWTIAPGTIAGVGGTLANDDAIDLTYADDAGSYLGLFTVTIAAQP